MSYTNINTTFTRTSANIEKMGAYYTDVSHCRVLGQMFKWPEEEVSVIEPSIGDGSAVFALTDVEENPNIKIFGVELNDEVADKLKTDERMEDLLKADFLNGVRIKNNAFSFCFGNPPYMEDSIDGEGRLELQFLQKVTNYLTKDGVICWVIPYRIFVEEKFFRFWHTRYDTLGVYRFWDEEFAKYKQVALIGRKCRTRVFLKGDFDNIKEKYNSLDKIEILPKKFDGEKIEISPSSAEEVTLFEPMVFDENEALGVLIKAGNDLDKLFSVYASVPKYKSSDVGSPPIPPKNDSMYLLSVCGVGSGKAGEEGKDLHLQRGVAEVVEDEVTEVEGEGKNKKCVNKVTTRTAIKMTVIQCDGQITHLM